MLPANATTADRTTEGYCEYNGMDYYFFSKKERSGEL